MYLQSIHKNFQVINFPGISLPRTVASDPQGTIFFLEKMANLNQELSPKKLFNFPAGVRNKIVDFEVNYSGRPHLLDIVDHGLFLNLDYLNFLKFFSGSVGLTKSKLFFFF